MRGMREIVTPTSTLEFLGVEIHAHKILLSLPKEKAENMKTQCRDFFDSDSQGTRKTNKEVILHSSRCSSSFSAISFLTTSTDSRKNSKEFKGWKSGFFYESSSFLQWIQYEFMQWIQKPKSLQTKSQITTAPQFDYQSRCIKTGLHGPSNHQGDMVSN